MERKLASIQRIISLEPITGADKIEKATVLGWELVVKKGEFKVGELCIYCEVDSVLPDKKEFEFLRDRKFRIKTIKLKGQVSQGICFPLGIIPMNWYYKIRNSN
jgi:RNA ligase (TIGR02306 family)